MPSPVDFTPDRVHADIKAVFARHPRAPQDILHSARPTSLLVAAGPHGPMVPGLPGQVLVLTVRVEHATPYDDLYAMLLAKLDAELERRYPRGAVNALLDELKVMAHIAHHACIALAELSDYVDSTGATAEAVLCDWTTSPDSPGERATKHVTKLIGDELSLLLDWDTDAMGLLREAGQQIDGPLPSDELRTRVFALLRDQYRAASSDWSALRSALVARGVDVKTSKSSTTTRQWMIRAATEEIQRLEAELLELRESPPATPPAERCRWVCGPQVGDTVSVKELSVGMLARDADGDVLQCTTQGLRFVRADGVWARRDFPFEPTSVLVVAEGVPDDAPLNVMQVLVEAYERRHPQATTEPAVATPAEPDATTAPVVADVPADATPTPPIKVGDLIAWEDVPCGALVLADDDIAQRAPDGRGAWVRTAPGRQMWNIYVRVNDLAWSWGRAPVRCEQVQVLALDVPWDAGLEQLRAIVARAAT